jgi:hypothetical protein
MIASLLLFYSLWKWCGLVNAWIASMRRRPPGTVSFDAFFFMMRRMLMDLDFRDDDMDFLNSTLVCFRIS